MVKMKEEIDYKTLQKKTQAELDHMTAQMEIRESEIELREALVSSFLPSLTLGALNGVEVNATN